MHSAGVTILSHNSFIFCTFHYKQCLYKLPEEDIQRSQIWRMSGASECPPWSYPTNSEELPVQKGMNTMGTVLQSDGAPHHIFHCFCLSGHKISLSLDRKRWTHSLTSLSRFDSFSFFLQGVCKVIVYGEKRKMQTHQMMPKLRSAEHIRNFVSSSVWKYVDFSNRHHG